MGVAVLMGILQGIPDGHGFWMQMEAALALAHCIKKVGIALEEDAGTASYHFPLYVVTKILLSGFPAKCMKNSLAGTNLLSFNR